MKLTGLQIAAAITLSGLTREALAAEAHVGRNTIDRIVNETASCREATIRKIVDILERRGVEFLPSEGVRLRPQEIEIFEGPERFEDFLAFLYASLERTGGDVVVSLVDEHAFQKAIRDIKTYRSTLLRLADSGKIRGRILAAAGDFVRTWADIRKQPRQANMPEVSFFAFGDNLALISFDHTRPPYVALHKTGPFAAAYKSAFNVAWENAETI